MTRPPAIRIPLAAALLLAIPLLAGCASWSTHGVVAGPEPLPVAVLPATVTAQVRHLADVADAPLPEGADEAALIAAELAGAGKRLDDALRGRLAGHAELAPVDPERVSAALAGAVPATDAEAAAVGRALGVPAVLRVDLAGYGRLKRRWVAIMIGSGVVEGVVQGVVAARVTDNRWIGLGLAVEEIAQEVLTWGGAAWLFNAHYAPITLQARLIASADGTAVWTDTVLVGIDRKALKKLPEAERKRRPVQLAVTAERAAGELADSVARAARRRGK